MNNSSDKILSMKVDNKQFTVKLTEDEVSDLRDFSQELDTSMYEDALMLGLINQILNQD
jgi:cell division protein ZapA (FtsZ GTPase activity inhibitor)